MTTETPTDNIDIDIAEEVEVEEIPPLTSERLADEILRLETRIREDRKSLSIFKNIKKDVIKMEKKKGRKTKDPNRVKKRATGFQLPVGVSDELADFLELTRGELIPRQNVLKLMTAYIKKWDLQKPEDRRKINLTLEGGAPLQELLNVDKTVVLDFFNLQTYLKPHFIKPGAQETPPTTPTPTPTIKTKVAAATTEVQEETTPPAEARRARTKVRRAKVATA